MTPGQVIELWQRYACSVSAQIERPAAVWLFSVGYGGLFCPKCNEPDVPEITSFKYGHSRRTLLLRCPGCRATWSVLDNEEDM